MVLAASAFLARIGAFLVSNWCVPCFGLPFSLLRIGAFLTAKYSIYKVELSISYCIQPKIPKKVMYGKVKEDMRDTANTISIQKGRDS